MNARKTAASLRRSGLAALAAVLIWTTTGCISPQPPPTGAPTQAATAAPTRKADPAIRIFFTNPQSSEAQQRRGGPEEALIEAINAAQSSVDMAMYNLSLENVKQALLAAQKRGVRVRMVMESDSLDGKVPGDLKLARIPIIGDRREGLMHNKYTIIDQAQVCTGSLNLTSSGSYQDNNELVCLRSGQLAQNYTADFEEMFRDDRFGPDAQANTPYPELRIDGIRVRNLFSPDDGAAKVLVDLLRSANQEIDFLAYSYTSNDLAEAMLERAQAGVIVRGVFEGSQVESNIGTEYPKLQAAGLDVRLDGNSALMHHKIILIDRQIVVFGSYNFSVSAERINDENIIILYDADLARQFYAEFQRVYNQSPLP